MSKTITATGNDRAEADAVLQRKRDLILSKQPDTEFGEIREYGNFEFGYKLIQDQHVKESDDD